MLQHHFLIAFRNIQRHNSSFFINLIGLSTGLACAILIFMWVQDERSFDKFHDKDSQLFQVIESSKENGTSLFMNLHKDYWHQQWQKTYRKYKLQYQSCQCKKKISIFQCVTVTRRLRAVAYLPETNSSTTFSFPLLQGNKQQVLNDKTSIVISEKLAKGLFGIC